MPSPSGRSAGIMSASRSWIAQMVGACSAWWGASTRGSPPWGEPNRLQHHAGPRLLFSGCPYELYAEPSGRSTSSIPVTLLYATAPPAVYLAHCLTTAPAPRCSCWKATRGDSCPGPQSGESDFKTRAWGGGQEPTNPTRLWDASSPLWYHPSGFPECSTSQTGGWGWFRLWTGLEQAVTIILFFLILIQLQLQHWWEWGREGRKAKWVHVTGYWPFSLFPTLPPPSPSYFPCFLNASYGRDLDFDLIEHHNRSVILWAFI